MARDVVRTLRKDDFTTAVLEPLPASLTEAELDEALRGWGGGALDAMGWLQGRLFDVTGRRYHVESEPSGWVKDGAKITYDPIVITDAE